MTTPLLVVIGRNACHIIVDRVIVINSPVQVSSRSYGADDLRKSNSGSWPCVHSYDVSELFLLSSEAWNCVKTYWATHLDLIFPQRKSDRSVSIERAHFNDRLSREDASTSLSHGSSSSHGPVVSLWIKSISGWKSACRPP